MRKTKKLKKPINMPEFKCDNGKTYYVPEGSCPLCEHGDILWDYTNGPYGCICDVGGNPATEGCIGKCKYFKEAKHD